ncbi:MAG: VWA domain-containing protein, partial [Proteobacteria bacterium]|nr:VWA domain-containing protein [Pseudomonadota bacterium]
AARNRAQSQRPTEPGPPAPALDGDEVDIAEGQIEKKRLNAIFAFDTTGSMTRWVENVQEKMEYLATGLLRLLDMEIELVGVGDHVDGRNMLQIKPFSNNLDKLKKSIKELQPTDGGDTPEAFECLFRVLNSVDYPVPTVLILITDSIPHDMDGYEGDDDGCPFGVDYLTELEDLNSRLKKVYLVSCATDPHILAMQRQLVGANGLLELADFRRLVNLVMAILMDEVGELDYFVDILEKQRGPERRQEVLSLLQR